MRGRGIDQLREVDRTAHTFVKFSVDEPVQAKGKRYLQLPIPDLEARLTEASLTRPS